jgi:hypothetical protein
MTEKCACCGGELGRVPIGYPRMLVEEYNLDSSALFSTTEHMIKSLENKGFVWEKVRVEVLRRAGYGSDGMPLKRELS